MTIREIAEIANVSPATISIVLSGKPGVSQEKRKEILNILKDNNFDINNRTRKIQKNKRNYTFIKYHKSGLLVEENAGFIARILDSIQLACSKLKYNLNIIVVDKSLQDAISEIDYEQTSGVFIVGSEIDEKDYYLLEEIKVSYVVVDNIMPNFPCNAITMDNKEMLRKVFNYLFSLPLENKFTYIGSKLKSQNFKERFQEFNELIVLNNLTKDDYNVIEGEPSIKGAYKAVNDYLDNGGLINKKIITANDIIAIGTIKALKERNYKIPEDVVITGFDDIYLCDITTPSLTTIHVNRTQIGRYATLLLNDLIMNNPPTYTKLKINGDLILRDSTKI